MLSLQAQRAAKSSGRSPSAASQARSSGVQLRSTSFGDQAGRTAWMSTPTGRFDRAHRAKGPLWERLKWY